jgi:hypothetical protein
MKVRLERPPRARLTMLILSLSKYFAMRSPQPHWLLPPFPEPLRTVESPTSQSVGRVDGAD